MRGYFNRRGWIAICRPLSWVNILEFNVGFAFVTACLQTIEIILPAIAIGKAQFVKISPAVKTSVVVVVENESHRIVTDRFNAFNVDVFLANLQHFLTRTMALDLGSW